MSTPIFDPSTPKRILSLDGGGIRGIIYPKNTCRDGGKA